MAKTARQFSDHCIYTIRAYDQLLDWAIGGGEGRFQINQRWTTAAGLLETAKKAGEVLPIIFARAQATGHVVSLAHLTKIVIREERSVVSFNELRFLPVPFSKELVTLRTGKPMSWDFIRPYAICKTPAGLG